MDPGIKIDQIRQGFAYVQSLVSIGRNLNLTDPNTRAEDFVGGLLNILYDFELVNANDLTANFPCIDLIDRKQGVGVQVSAEKGSAKISNTIDCLKDCLQTQNLCDHITKLIVFKLKPKQKSYTIHKHCPGVKFDWRNDVFDFNDLINEAKRQIQNDEKLNQLHSLVIRYTTLFTDYSTSIPSLYLPRKETNPSWLSYSSRSTKLVGRNDELKALEAFLKTEDRFSWWLMTGPAGSGKSRLALELCNLYQEKGWYVGFLRRSSKVFDWAKYKPLKKTLIVVDYVMGRTKEISDLILELSLVANTMDATTRILLLEREAQTWQSNFLREDSLSESAAMRNSKYQSPELQLGGLGEADMLQMAKETSISRHGSWDEKSERRFLEWMNRYDIVGRPLYVMLLSEFPNVDDPSELLRIVLKKEALRRQEQIKIDLFKKHENLLFISTLSGGILPNNLESNQINEAVSSGLLPSIGDLDFDNYFSLTGALNETDSIQGMKPDLLGELYVLDRLKAEGLVGLPNRTLLKLAYDLQPDDVIAFVTRCFYDFPKHPSFKKLFDLPLDSSERRLTKAKLMSQCSCFPSIIFDEFLQSEIDEMTVVGDSYINEKELNKWVALSEYNYACSLMFPRIAPFFLSLLGINRTDSINEAKNRLQAVISRVEENSSVRFMALLNLGTLQNNDDAFEAYSEVIDSKFSEDETKACALNNRAYIFQERKDDAAAIVDREKVLDLPHTSADRRFVALFGCGESHFTLGTYQSVVHDMTRILESTDIVKTDKICALIVRSVAHYFLEEVQINAIYDLEQATEKLIGLIQDVNLQLKLSECFSTKEWGKSSEVLSLAEGKSNDEVMTLLSNIFPLLANQATKDKGFREKNNWDNLRKLTIKKARKMRIHTPTIPK